MRRLVVCVCAALAAAPVIAHAQGGDWGVHRDPFDPNVILRYKNMLARDPHDPSALAKLLEMYRRYRTVDLLKDEYNKILEKKPTEHYALVVLGRLYHSTGDDVRARDLWSRAVAVQDNDAATWLSIGELDKAAGHAKDARGDYEKALAHAGKKEMKKKALRALADLALAGNDIDAANGYFKQFLDLDPNNAQLWIERGDAMLAAQRREIALESYAAAEKLLGSDPGKRMEVISRRGQALEGMGKDDEAVAEYRRAIKLAPKGYYLETELTGRIIDIYRRKQALDQLLAQYEKDWPEATRGHFEWNTLGKLYEERGAQDKAIAALKKAVGKAPYELETQRRLIQLLENSGRDDEALAQYEAVVRVAPGEARFQLELADRYWRRGQEKKALDALTRLESRFPSDAGVLSAVADMYTRWNKQDLAIAEYERLAKLEPDDAAHLVTLGEQYWDKQDKARAIATWKRIIANGKAHSFAKLGEVLAEHGSYKDAEVNYNEAIKRDPKNADFHKGLAGVYEQQGRTSSGYYQKALDEWQRVLDLLGGKATDRLARRDARRHYVTVLLRTGRESEMREKWKKGFANGEVEAGYFLVELFAKKPPAGEPRASLEALAKLVPDDQDVIMDLVKVYRVARKYDEAVALLLKLAQLSPSRERDVYTQIAEIKTEARKDDEALEWQNKAVAKSPSDPTGYERLAERYVEMQRFADAIAAYEKTVKLDPHNDKAAFALAQLYRDSGTPMKSIDLLRNVLRTANQEETIGRAGHQAIDLEEMTDTLGELEKVIVPLSFTMAHKPIYRRVLVDLYLRYVPRLVARVRHGNDEVKKAAKAELDRIGAHGLRPLLEALRDDKDQTQQRIAVQVLGHLGNKGAAAPLVHMARVEPPRDTRRIGSLAESPDREVRVEALVAAGRLGDPAVLNDVLPLVDHPEIAMKEAATFTLGRAGDKRAVPVLIKALSDPHGASVQALACLGLAQIDDPRAGPALVVTLKDAARSDAVRAACAYAIGARRYAAGAPALVAALDDNRGETQRLAAWALGQLGEAKAIGPLVRAYFARAGQHADELVWAIARVAGTGLLPSAPGDLGDYPMRNGKYNQNAAIANLPGPMPAKMPPAQKLVADHATEIANGLVEALGEHRDVVVSVLADLDAAPDHLALGALTPVTSDAKVAAAMQTIGQAVAPAVAAHLSAADPKVRALAVSVIAKLDTKSPHDVDAAIGKALVDPNAEQVRAAAMSAVVTLARRRGAPPPELVAVVVKTLSSGTWGDRRVAALALGALGGKGDVTALVRAAGDSSGFVREAVATALGDVGGGPGVEQALERLAKDDVAQVREAAEKARAKAKK